MTLLKSFLLVLAGLWYSSGLALFAQGPSCNWSTDAALTSAIAGPTHDNNTRSPVCNAFTLNWSSTGFSSVTIQLEGSDDGSTWAAFSGAPSSGICSANCVLVGTNPATNKSGTITVQAVSTLAHIRANVTGVSGTGSVSYQIWGYQGVTPLAKVSGGGSGGTTAFSSITSGTNGSATMTCGTGCAIGVSGSGANNATSVLSKAPGGSGASLATTSTSTAGDCAEYASDGITLQDAGQPCGAVAQLHVVTIPIAGSPIATGTGSVGLPASTNFSCTISKAMITGNASGSVTVDIWKASAAIPSSGNKISATAPVTLSAAQLNQNSPLTGWTTAVSSNDVFWANVATADGVLTNATVQLWCQ